MNLAQVIDQLSPANRKLAEEIIAQLAERDGIKIAKGDLPNPIESAPLWVAAMQGNGKSPHTIRMYEADVKAYLAKDPQPTAMTIQGYVAARLKQVTAARVNSEQKALKSFFTYAYKHGLWHTNPTADMGLVREQSKEIECPTPDEVKALIGHRLRRKNDDDKFKVMLMLLVNTGLRMEEACSVRRARIDLDNLEVKVVGKGNKERTVPISAFVAAALDAYMQKYPTKTPYLFPASTASGFWSHSGFYKALSLACKMLGIRQLHPHQLRHFFATATLEHGAKLEVISKILGHSSVAITADVYRHIALKEYHEEHAKHDPLARLGPPLLPQGQIINGEAKDI